MIRRKWKIDLRRNWFIIWKSNSLLPSIEKAVYVHLIYRPRKSNTSLECISIFATPSILLNTWLQHSCAKLNSFDELSAVGSYHKDQQRRSKNMNRKAVCKGPEKQSKQHLRNACPCIIPPLSTTSSFQFEMEKSWDQDLWNQTGTHVCLEKLWGH